MIKWAQYLISEVSYSPDHKRILQVKQHEDLDGQINEGEIVDRDVVVSNLKKGKTYMTIHNGSSKTWKKGEKVRGFSVDGDYYIRTDKNKVNLDNLGMINEL